MTSRELLPTPPERLSPAERQTQHVLAVASIPVPYPACQLPVDAVAAAGLYVDEYACVQETPDYHCPHCQAVLDRVTPLIAFGPGWHWQLNFEWLTERLNKARLFEQQDARSA